MTDEELEKKLKELSKKVQGEPLFLLLLYLE